MSGNAGSIMSIASGFRAMIEAITTTNSGKPSDASMKPRRSHSYQSRCTPHRNPEI
jgi:hypothetical protein